MAAPDENGDNPAEEHGRDFEIIVNAQSHDLDRAHVSYEEIVHIAYPEPAGPDTRYTVTFRNAEHPREGSLAPGESVTVKHRGTIFNVKATSKS